MDKMSIVRTVVLLLALTNQALAFAGKSPLPISDVGVEAFINGAFTVAASLWTWWKNNYVGKKGKAQKAVLEKHDLA